jgi:glycosyltransferase involved in cell wall biosynthesis
MKILFFIDSLSAGGKERRLTELIKNLQLAPGIEIALIVMAKEIHYKEILNLPIEIHYIIRKSKKDLSVFKQFHFFCKNFDPDIVHCWDSMTAVYSVPACQLLGIILVNGMVVDTPVKRNIFNKHWLRAKISFPFSDIIIGNSKSGLKAYGASPRRSVCIYNGMNLSRFINLKDPQTIKKEFGINDDSFFVAGMVAAFEERKDYKTLIKSAVKLINEHDNVRFILIGKGETLDQIKQSVPSFLNKKIIFTGARSDVESIVNIFDIGILLTNSKVHGEGISNSIIEYMALGKPVIATQGGGTNEVVFDNNNGFLIEAENSNQLIEKFNYLLDNKNKMKELGENGSKMVKEKFDIEIMTNNYKKVYQNLLKQKEKQ